MADNKNVLDLADEIHKTSQDIRDIINQPPPLMVTCQRPEHPPVRGMTTETHGIEPVFTTHYRRVVKTNISDMLHSELQREEDRRAKLIETLGLEKIQGAWMELLHRVVDAAADMDCIDDMEFPHEVEPQDMERYAEVRKTLYAALEKLDVFEKTILDYDRKEESRSK